MWYVYFHSSLASKKIIQLQNRPVFLGPPCICIAVCFQCVDTVDWAYYEQISSKTFELTEINMEMICCFHSFMIQTQICHEAGSLWIRWCEGKMLLCFNNGIFKSAVSWWLQLNKNWHFCHTDYVSNQLLLIALCRYVVCMLSVAFNKCKLRPTFSVTIVSLLSISITAVQWFSVISYFLECWFYTVNMSSCVRS